MNSLKNPRLVLSALILVLMISGSQVLAQLQTGGAPAGYNGQIMPGHIPVFDVQVPPSEAMVMEDERSGIPYQFAINQPVDISIHDFGVITSDDGKTRIHRATIHAPGARGLILYFDAYRLPEGGKLFVYNPENGHKLGAFTFLNNNRFSTFATRLLAGDRLVVEYNAAVGTELPDLHINEVGYAYRGVWSGDGINTGFGAAGECEINVKCAEGSGWHDQVRGVTRLQIKKGGSSSYCTGSLVNNTKNDGTPYVLTADHCGRFATALDLSKWVFDFSYQSTGCPNPVREPDTLSMGGAIYVASGGNSGSNGSDFYLVRLMEEIPDSFNVHFNGWNRSTEPSQSGVTIHHPQGDIKKISTYTTPVQPAFWPGDTKLAHWLVVWSPTVSGHGATELGSSGSPLFDGQGMIIGTLTGGDSSCDSANLTLPDYYGMFSYHWDQNGTDSTQQLKPWLDPVGKDVMSLNGWALGVQPQVTEEKISLFPNPVMDELTVRGLKPNTKNIVLSVYSSTGALALTRSIAPDNSGEFRINLKDLHNGLYLLVVGDETASVKEKFLKIRK